ncbi:MAG: nucleotide exchange factor GrpE [Clostridia bacterium]|nr:nucleotide exchange factor GrpE [Clostridia bacterium]
MTGKRTGGYWAVRRGLVFVLPREEHEAKNLENEASRPTGVENDRQALRPNGAGEIPGLDNRSHLETGERDEPSELAEVEQLKRELEQKIAWGEEMYHNFLRARADLDNYRRRTRKEMEEITRFATEEFITSLLPVLDNFERALSAAEKGADYETLVSGMQLIYRQFKDLLSRHGLESIQSLNSPFDPTLHDALATEDRADVEEATVVEEFTRGYLLKGKVIRPALVKVARPISGSSQSEHSGM